MNDKFLSFLGITKKSGNLVLGMDAVKENIAKGCIVLTLVAKDISESSLKKIEFICEKNNIKVVKVDYTMWDIGYILGKCVGIIGISDENFAKKIISIIS